MSQKLLLIFILLISLGMASYYLMEIGSKIQQRERIQPLLDYGINLNDSINFDKRFSDQEFLWPWQENKPYYGDEIKFAEMWLSNTSITEVLLVYYYCAPSNYYCLVWLFGNLVRGLSYWEDAVTLVVHGDVNGDGISNYDSLLGSNADALKSLEPSPVIICTSENNLSKERIKILKVFSSDSRMDESERKAMDLMTSIDISRDRYEWIAENVTVNPADIYDHEKDMPNTMDKSARRK